MPASVWRVTEFEAGRSFTWTSSPVPGLVLAGGHVLTADGQGTTAEFSLEATGPLGTVLGPLLRPTVFSRNTRMRHRGPEAPRGRLRALMPRLFVVALTPSPISRYRGHYQKNPTC